MHEQCSGQHSHASSLSDGVESLTRRCCCDRQKRESWWGEGPVGPSGPCWQTRTCLSIPPVNPVTSPVCSSASNPVEHRREAGRGEDQQRRALCVGAISLPVCVRPSTYQTYKTHTRVYFSPFLACLQIYRCASFYFIRPKYKVGVNNQAGVSIRQMPSLSCCCIKY